MVTVLQIQLHAMFIPVCCIIVKNVVVFHYSFQYHEVLSDNKYIIIHVNIAICS